jgi:phosphate starvation-inducible protein PhoH
MSKKMRPKRGSDRPQSGRTRNVTSTPEVGKQDDNSPYVFQRDKISFDLSIKNLPWTNKQKEIIARFLDKGTKVLLLKGPAGTSKAQPLDSKILTPSGWITMGELKVNDEVISSEGTPIKVLSIHPQGNKDVYKVSFSDGSHTECCDDHLWSVKTEHHRNYRKKQNGKKIKHEHDGVVLPLKEIKTNLIGRGGRKNFSIPIVNPIQFFKKPHIIHPYLMGALLGDGGLTHGIKFSSNDEDIIDKIKTILPVGHTINHINKYDYRIIGNNRNNSILNAIKEFNLFGKLSEEKFIPKEYLYSDINSRIELLRGLMDTDGHVSNKGVSCVFTTTSENLKNDFTELVNSLGGIVKTVKNKNYFNYKGIKKQGLDSYCNHISLPPNINPFFIERKAKKVVSKTKYKPVRYITSVELIGKKECQCILVDHPKHLYVTDNYIVTHNTTLAMYCGLTLLNMRRISDMVLVRSAVESSDSKLGFLPGTLDEKIAVYLTPFHDKFEELLCKAQLDKLQKDNRLTICPINFARGLHFSAKFVCADEVQNFSKKEIHTLMSRIGEFSKVFLCGDPEQSDLPYGKSGFDKVYNLFDNDEAKEQGIFCMELGEEDIVRSVLCRFITHKFKELYLFDQHKDAQQHQLYKENQHKDSWKPSEGK